MFDVIIVLSIVVCFGLAGVYARLCNILIAPVADRPRKNPAT